MWLAAARSGRLVLAGVLVAGWLPAACEKPPQPAATRPTSSAGAPAEPKATLMEPAATLPAAAEPEPELPGYLAVVARFQPDKPIAVAARPEPGNRLVIETRNVQRLRINRDAVPLDQRRSISLQLDGQGLEWVAGSRVVEFERSVNGVWSPVKP